MKWFKHISDSLDDPFIFDLIDRFGSDGYLVFFGILEIYSREFKPKDDWKLNVTRSQLRAKFHKRQDTLIINSLKHIQNSGKWDIVFDDKQVTIFIPKFKEIIDDWTGRKLRSCSVVAPKKHNVIKKEEVRSKNKEIKTEEPEKTPAPKINKLGDWIDQNPGMKIYLNKFEKNSWPKIRNAIGEALKKNKHPGAIKDLIIYIYSRGKIKEPHNYFWKTINIISGNYYANENEEKHKEIKSEPIPNLGQIFDNMLKGIK